MSGGPGEEGGASSVAASLVPLLQEQKVDFLERGPVLGVSPPAAQHQLIHRVGADRRLGQVSLPPLVSKELSSILDDLLI